jgi:hypothetical protein
MKHKRIGTAATTALIGGSLVILTAVGVAARGGPPLEEFCIGDPNDENCVQGPPPSGTIDGHTPTEAWAVDPTESHGSGEIDSSQGWDPCVVIGTWPDCQNVPPNQTSSHEPEVAQDPDPSDSGGSSACFEPDRSPTAGDVAACAHDQPVDPASDAADGRDDIGEFDCTTSPLGPIVACPA